MNIRSLLIKLRLKKFWDTDKWYHPLYRKFGFVRRLVWKWEDRKYKEAKNVLLG